MEYFAATDVRKTRRLVGDIVNQNEEVSTFYKFTSALNKKVPFQIVTATARIAAVAATGYFYSKIGEDPLECYNALSAHLAATVFTVRFLNGEEKHKDLQEELETSIDTVVST